MNNNPYKPGIALTILVTLMSVSILQAIIPGRPVILKEPQDQTVPPGSDATFTVVAYGELLKPYQWQKLDDNNLWQDIPGATGPSLSIPNATADDNGQYRVIVSNPMGRRVSATAALRFLGAPVIIHPPQGLAGDFMSVSFMDELQLSVFSSGSTPLNYQWYWEGQAIPGANAENLSIRMGWIDDRHLEFKMGNSLTQTVELNENLVGLAGKFFVEVSNSDGRDQSNEATLEVDATFAKIVNDPTIKEMLHSRIEWGDYDGDGDLDVYGELADSSLLYWNKGGGSFERATDINLTSDKQGAGASTSVDYDNDGDLDLFVTIFDRSRIFLYCNDGAGSFTEIAETVLGHVELDIAGRSAWADYDNDGYLDLFLSTRENDHLYHNNGAGAFKRITAGAIVNDDGDRGPAVWGDYDNDGDLDLFVNYFEGGSNFLYQNNGNGAFTPKPEALPGLISAGGGSCNWIDFDNDLDLDLYVANINGVNFLYRNDGLGNFNRITEGRIVKDIETSDGSTWGDYDNDGDLDLFVANYTDEKNSLYRNNGAGVFEKVLSGALANERAWAVGCSWIDYDLDGFLDLHVRNAIEIGSSFLYRNQGNHNNWLKIRCQGSASNREGVGAKVKIMTSLNEREHWQMREIQRGNTRFSSDAEAHFGVGEASIVDLVRVEWPSWAVQELTKVEVNQTRKLSEPIIWIEPKNQAVFPDEDATFTVITAIPGTFTYQWRLNDQVIPGATEASLVINNAQTSDQGRYTVILSDADNNERIGAQANLQVPVIPPTISWQPQRQALIPGQDVSLEAQASGSLPLSYQWEKDGEALAGMNDPILIIKNASIEDQGEYSVIVSNRAGMLESESVLVSAEPVILAVNVEPRRLVAPEQSAASVSPGAKVTFSVEAFGPEPLSYTWRKDGKDIRGKAHTLILSNVQESDAGVYTVEVRNAFGANISSSIKLEVDSSFTKISSGPLVEDDLGAWSWPCWGDYDNDGDIDLFIPRRGLDYGSPIHNALFRNDGGAAFTRLSTGPFVENLHSSIMASWADYNNDGFSDLFICNSDAINELYQNNGNGVFTRVDEGFFTDKGLSSGLAWADYDNDGHLDLFVVQFDLQYPNLLYHNLGNGHFSSVVGRFPAVCPSSNRLYGEWADYDDDGDPDLFVGHGWPAEANNSLYRNEGDGFFTQILEGIVANDGGESMGGFWGDYDNDGRLDLFVANWSTATKGPDNFLYRNLGQGAFAKVTEGAIVSDGGRSIGGGAWGDYDNDGDLDLFVPNGFVFTPQENFLYRNEGDSSFTKLSTGSLVNDGGISWGAGWGDYDNDGFLDLYVINNSQGHGSSEQRNFFYRNNGNNNHWLKVKCVGTAANRDGIGAKLRALAKINGHDQWQLRIMKANYAGLIPAHFGLGAAEIIDTLRIEWPGPSFTVQELHDIPVDLAPYLTVVEPEVHILPKSIQKLKPGDTATFTVELADVQQPVTYQWQFKGKDLDGETGATLELTDIQYEDAGRYTVLINSPEHPDLVSASAFLQLAKRPQLQIGVLDEEAGLQLILTGDPGFSYVLEVSENLEQWAELETLSISDGSQTVTYLIPNSLQQSHNYYRAYLVGE
jgi:enediyne biosynthesis protein E4